MCDTHYLGDFNCLRICSVLYSSTGKCEKQICQLRARVCARALCVIEQCIAVLAVRHQDSKFKAVSNECIRKNPQMIELFDGWHLSDNLGLSESTQKKALSLLVGSV